MFQEPDSEQYEELSQPQDFQTEEYLYEIFSFGLMTTDSDSDTVELDEKKILKGVEWDFKPWFYEIMIKLCNAHVPAGMIVYYVITTPVLLTVLVNF